MKTLLEQFQDAPKKQVVPLKMEEISKDERWLPVNRYPWNLHAAKDEAGLIGHLHGRIVHAVYERVFCVGSSVDIRSEFKDFAGKNAYDEDDNDRYVAAATPGERFMGERAQ